MGIKERIQGSGNRVQGTGVRNAASECKTGDTGFLILDAGLSDCGFLIADCGTEGFRNLGIEELKDLRCAIWDVRLNECRYLISDFGIKIQKLKSKMLLLDA